MPKSKLKLWFVYTCDLQYDIVGAGDTEEEAQRAVWREYKRTNNSGYGIPAEVKSLKDFFEYYATRSYHLAAGETGRE